MSIYKPGRPNKGNPPDEAGEYRFRNKDTNEIDYIGETNNLRRREREHYNSDKPLSPETHDFEWQRADGRSTSGTRREHESEKIGQHNPLLNIRGGGGGRTAK
ncbi:GIY-YIG nuclease family protein [Burkholderiaceae bacterium DAT-1]|nr:GIY-YIG nuclease family protein [Burkholderiaceae bacterium DAT-1]